MNRSSLGTAVVTGAGRGIGRAVAERLADDGFAVGLVARTESEIVALASELEARGATAFPVVGDIADRASIERAVGALHAEFGDLDVLVNNAGIMGTWTNFEDSDPEEWWRVIEVNVRGTALVTRAVLPRMVARGQGRIVNVSSDVGIRPIRPGLSAYAASKAALINFTENLAVQLAETGVKVFAFTPGLVHTPGTEVFRDIAPPSAWSPIEQAADVASFLASGRGDAFSGLYFGSPDQPWSLVDDVEAIREQDLFTLRVNRRR